MRINGTCGVQPGFYGQKRVSFGTKEEADIAAELIKNEKISSLRVNQIINVSKTTADEKEKYLAEPLKERIANATGTDRKFLEGILERILAK